MTPQSIHDRIMSRGETSAEQPARPRAGRVRRGVLYTLGAVAIGLGGYAAASYDVFGTFLSQPAIAETRTDKPGLAETPFLEHSRQAGLKACSTVFPVLGEMLANGAKYSVTSSWNTKAPDKHAIEALVGMDYTSNGYSGPAAGVVYAAPVGSDCEGAMIRVTPIAAPCANIPSSLPQGSKLANTLGQVAVYSLGNNGGNALLLPSGNSCVVISVASAAKAQS